MERNKLLIADGSSLSRSILKRIFEKDYIVLQAENGRDAFELFREHFESLAAVITALHMPKYDGIYFMEHIAAMYRTNTVPIIFVAANAKEVRRIETCRYRPTDYVTKPFNTDAVRQVVLDCVEKHSNHGFNDEDLHPLTMLNRLMTVLNHCLEDNGAFQTALGIVGRYLGADRVSLYMKPLVSDRYQWRRDNIPSSYRKTYRWMLENEWPAPDEWLVSIGPDYGMRKHYRYYFKRYGIRNMLCLSIEGIRREKAYLVIENPGRTEQDDEIYFALHNCFSLMLKTVEMGIIDEQTGVYNRDFFTKYLLRLARMQTKSLGIVVMNLNNMHQYTSVYGQAAGDELLLHTANIILSHPEAISFRTDGDEFAAVMMNCSEAAVERLMEEITAECRQMNIGLSMGCQWRDKAIRPEEMYHMADASMREHKAAYYSTRNIVQK
ncbi:MAG: diguanylate cyclase [Oscillospiraceae bacterium]|nr:diguanylate cyclase [Oscillospiraceae bacterium]